MSSSTEKLQTLAENLDNLDAKSFEHDEPARGGLLSAAQALCRRLEKPWDKIARMHWADPQCIVSVKIGIDSGLFKSINISDEPRSIHELATATESSPQLLKHVARHLAAAGVLYQHDDDSFSATASSREFMHPQAQSAIDYTVEIVLPFLSRVPECLRRCNFRTGPGQPLWPDISTSGQTYYDWMRAHPQRMHQTIDLRNGFGASRQPWYDIIPSHALMEAQDVSTPLVVDVGGGTGHDLKAFLQKHPDAAGRVVLQDRAEVLESAEVGHDGAIRKMTHNFFTTQPVQGARVYFMHSILHNWPDPKAREILQNLKPALKKGYSKLLVQESLTRDQNPPELNAAVDLRMMFLFEAGERSEKDWGALFASVGMKIVRVWEPILPGQSVIEVDLVD